MEKPDGSTHYFKGGAGLNTMFLKWKNWTWFAHDSTDDVSPWMEIDGIFHLSDTDVARLIVRI